MPRAASVGYHLRFSDEYGAFPAQRQFTQTVLDPKVYAAGYIGGYGAGKTLTSAVVAVVAASLNPGLPGMLVSPTYRMMADTTYIETLNVLEAAGIPYRENRSDWKITIPAFRDASIWFRSGKKPERLKGPNLAWAGIDEAALCRDRAWQVVISRVRHPRARQLLRWVTTTPEGFNWVYDYFAQGRRGYVMVNAPTYENKALPPDYVDQLREALDEAHAQTYIEGKFVPLYGRQVYPVFSRSQNLDQAIVYNQDLPLFWAHDFNVDPMCSVVFQMPTRRDVHVIDEIVLPSSNTPETVREFVSRYSGHRGRVVVAGDPSGRARDTRQESHRSDFDIIKAELDAAMKYARIEQLVARKAPSVRRRHNTVNALFRNAGGRVSLLYHPSCIGLVASTERTVRKEGSQQVDKAVEWKHRGRTFVGVEHLTDALGYPICELFPEPARMRLAA